MNSLTFHRKWWAAAAGGLCLLALAVVFARGPAVNLPAPFSRSPATAAAQSTQTLSPMRVEPALVSADGYVFPVHRARLSLAVPGTVASVYVSEGAWVEKDAPLLMLENRSQMARLLQATAERDQAAANLDLLKAGARPQEIVQAQAGVDAAQARLDRLLAGATPAQVAEAQSAVAVAQAELARVQAGAMPDEIATAAATLDLARARTAQAQAQYDQVAWRGDAARLPQSLALQEATIEQTRAEAAYQSVVKGATPEEIRVAVAQVEQAQAALDKLLAPAAEEDVAAAQAELAAAQAELARVQAGARRQEVTLAQAQLAAAQAGVAQAEAALRQTILRAPFAGRVGALRIEAGEYVTPGLAVVELGDTGGWLVETDNLSELEVVHLAVGDSVEIVCDALPDQTLAGVVTAIRPAGEQKRGEVTYTVTVRVEGDAPASLYWGMTAVVRKVR